MATKMITTKVRKRYGRRGVSQIVGSVVGLGVTVLTISVLAIILAAFKNRTTDTTAQGVIGNGLTMFSNFTNQLGTVGTIAGVMLLLFILAAAGFWGYQKIGTM